MRADSQYGTWRTAVGRASRAENASQRQRQAEDVGTDSSRGHLQECSGEMQERADATDEQCCCVYARVA